MADFFDIEDGAAEIRVLQERLRTLAAFDGRLPPLFIDGIYGDETVRAVRAFQELYGLPVSGEFDFRTQRAIEAEYASGQRARERFPGAPQFESFLNGRISRGDSFDGVLALQLLLRSLAEYDDAFSVERDGFYGESTDSAVRFFQRLRGREESDGVDRELWNELVLFSEKRREND